MKFAEGFGSDPDPAFTHFVLYCEIWHY